MAERRSRKAVSLDIVLFEFGYASYVRVTHNDNGFSDGERPHSGFAVGVRMYARLVVRRRSGLVVLCCSRGGEKD